MYIKKGYMMFEVDIEEIKKNILLLNSEIKDYNQNNIELINTIKMTENYWKGDDYNFYIEKLNNQNIKISKYLELLSKKINMYKFLYNEYKEYGKKIRININTEEKIINKINKCIDLIQKILDEYKEITMNTTDTKEKSALYESIKKLDEIKQIYILISEDVKKIYKKVRYSKIKISSEIEKQSIEQLDI